MASPAKRRRIDNAKKDADSESAAGSISSSDSEHESADEDPSQDWVSKKKRFIELMFLNGTFLQFTIICVCFWYDFIFKPIIDPSDIGR